MSADLNVNEAIDQALPGWMRMLGFGHWRSAAAAVSLVVDALFDGVFQGRLAPLPGQVSIPGIDGLGGFNNVDALPLIGRDRRIVQGWTEPTWDYAERLRKWRTPGYGWQRAGMAFGLLTQIRGLLAPSPPTVRLVQQSVDKTGSHPELTGGYWHTIEAGGDLVYNTPDGAGLRVNGSTGAIAAETGAAAPWDWDSTLYTAPAEPDPLRAWLIIYAPTNVPLDADGGTWGDGQTWGALDSTAYGIGPHPSPKTWGTHSTLDHVDMIRGVAMEWGAAGVIIDHIIVAFDPASFDPLTPGPYTGLPDGYWGHDHKVSGGVAVRTRLATARYWKGTPEVHLT